MSTLVQVGVQAGQQESMTNSAVQVNFDQENQVLAAMRARIERLRARLI